MQYLDTATVMDIVMDLVMDIVTNSSVNKIVTLLVILIGNRITLSLAHFYFRIFVSYPFPSG